MQLKLCSSAWHGVAYQCSYHKNEMHVTMRIVCYCSVTVDEQQSSNLAGICVLHTQRT